MNYSNKATEVTYQTPNGGTAKGWIIDDKTYKDPYGQTRVDVGSTVPTADGTYTLTHSGGVKTPGSIYDDLKTGLEKSGSLFGEAKDAKIKSINSATDRRLSEIANEESKAQRTADEANTNAYRAYMTAIAPHGGNAEKLTKLGLNNSGVSESSKISLANTYQTAMNENERAKNEYLAELSAARRDAIYEGDLETANAIDEYSRLVAQHGIETAEILASRGESLYNSAIAADNMKDKLFLSQEQFEYDKDLQDRKLALSEAEARRNLVSKLYDGTLSLPQIAKMLRVSESELFV